MAIFPKVVGLVAAFGARVEIIFAHILVFPACAIEVQHINENSPTIFIDMFGPKWARRLHNLAHFPSWDPCITPGYLAWYLNVLPTSGSLFRSLFYAFMPQEGIYTCVFAPPPPLSDENPVMLYFFAYAEIIFAHILVFPACAIEVQHINENSPTVWYTKAGNIFAHCNKLV